VETLSYKSATPIFVCIVEQKPSTKMIPGPENSVNHKVKTRRGRSTDSGVKYCSSQDHRATCLNVHLARKILGVSRTPWLSRPSLYKALEETDVEQNEDVSQRHPIKAMEGRLNYPGTYIVLVIMETSTCSYWGWYSFHRK